ncbi:MAG: serine/threonine protein kinase [Deltaproteobacteria bacterium]|nr:serine/threonine protein kinase [Deltaproteobacteria bacterium]
MSAQQRYKVTEKVDAGGMAEIFRGYAFSLDGIQKQVAIKRVRPHLATNKVFIKMFIDEARLSMRLNHGNITQVFDVGRAQGTYFLVMEFVDGANVRKIMQTATEKGYRIPVEIAVYVIVELCKALAHAHGAVDDEGKPLNIVHRDVSPPNVMISRQGEVKITDFGLAKAATQLEATDPGVVKGKFSYLSPEAAEGKAVDARADIFSAGIILHELLTGRRLFMGKTDIETVELVRKCEVPPPSAANPEVDHGLDEVVLRALAKDVKKRYHSAHEFGDALARHLFARGIKVTNFDVAQMMRLLFSEDEMGESVPRRVLEIVQEEVINLSSMGHLPGVMPAEGFQPLDLESFRGKKSPFEDIWKDYEGEVGETSSLTSLESLSAEGSSPAAMPGAPAPKTGGTSGRTWLLVAGGVIVLLALAGGYLWLFTDLFQ